MKTMIIIVCCLLALGFGYDLLGQSIPRLINYQGRLANADGTPIPTADYALSIGVWDAVTDGNLIWGPQLFDGETSRGHGARVPVVQGYFNVVLGPEDSAGRSLAEAFGSSNRFVQVTVSDRTPILPRQQILSAPFAIQAGNGSPPGTIVAFGGADVPEGWILCDGRTLRSNDYPRLFMAIGTSWGNAQDDADPMTNFRAPDFRGLFLRGVDNSPLMGTANRDPDRDSRQRIQASGGNFGNDVGTLQGDDLQPHTHRVYVTIRTGTNGNPDPNRLAQGNADNGGSTPTSGEDEKPVFAAGGKETRPKNASVNYIIKY